MNPPGRRSDSPSGAWTLFTTQRQAANQNGRLSCSSASSASGLVCHYRRSTSADCSRRDGCSTSVVELRREPRTVPLVCREKCWIQERPGFEVVF
jgi:hypothetical protein